MSKRLVGAVDEYDGDRFFTRLGGKGKTVATPLLLCLVCIELSDFVFAVDSIPAVLGISQARSVACVGLEPCLPYRFMCLVSCRLLRPMDTAAACLSQLGVLATSK